MDALEYVYVFFYFSVDFGFGGDRLAEMIERCADSLAIQIANRLNGICELLAGNKSSGHVVKGFEATEKSFEAITFREIEEGRFGHHLGYAEAKDREDLSYGGSEDKPAA